LPRIGGIINHRAVKNSQAWLVVLIAATFFFYEFIQMNMFNSIATSLMHAFDIDAEKLGTLSSFYFAANVIFLFLAGGLLDRCATRTVILAALSICILGTALLSVAHSFAWACVFRFLTGIGSAFCFLSVIRLASRWFPPNRMAMVTGVVVTIAMLGGYFSQWPMTLLAEAVHWRTALQYDAGVGVVFFLLILLFVQDYPEQHKAVHASEQKDIHAIGYFASARMAFLRLQNWLVGFCVCFLNLPVGLLGGLWGDLYLTYTHDVSRIAASNISSALFIGAIVGAPVAGFISDKIQLRRPPIFFGALVSLILISIVIFFTHLSVSALFILFFLTGLFTSVQIIAYPLVAENSKRIVTAMSVSVVNISVQGGSGIFQKFFGYLLDKHMFMRVHYISDNLSASDFRWAMWIFPIGFLLVMLLAKWLPETRGRQRVG